MAIRGILFDKDGTLLDFERSWTPINRRLAFQAANGDESLALKLLELGGYDRVSGKLGAGTLLAAGNNEEIAMAWHGHLGPERPSVKDLEGMISAGFEAGGREFAVPVCDLPPVLAGLKSRGLRLGIATSDSERGVHESLSSFDVLGLFDFISGYDSGHGAKPGPGPVHGFAEKVGLPCSEIMVVGDNTHDLDMGRAAGAACVVGVLTGTSGRGDLEPYADAVLDDITHIASLLDEMA